MPDGTVIWTSPTGKEFRTKPGGAELFSELTPRRRRTRAQERASRIASERNRNYVERERKREVEKRRFRNHMRDMLFLYKGKPSTSPFGTWINDPYEPEELPPDWKPPKRKPLPDDPPF